MKIGDKFRPTGDGSKKYFLLGNKKYFLGRFGYVTDVASGYYYYFRWDGEFITITKKEKIEYL